MGKIIASASVTFDGVFTGPPGNEDNMISWALPGVQETSKDNLHLFQSADAIMMGRVTYESVILSSGRRYLDGIASRRALKVRDSKFCEHSGCMLFHHEVLR